MLPESIQDMWISPGVTMGETLESHFAVGSTDVIVTLHDGSRYVATFFTYESIRRITHKNQATSECLAGKYFWASDMILIDKLDRESIEVVIQDLLQSGDFYSSFSRAA
jgi:hypothetical protein